MDDDDRLRRSVADFVKEICGNLDVPDLARAIDALTNGIARDVSMSEPWLNRLYMFIYKDLYPPKP